MTFRTFGENGLLLYGGAGKKDEVGDTDFIVISIVNRFIEFSFDLGGGAVVLRSMKPITLGMFLYYFYLYGIRIFFLIHSCVILPTYLYSNSSIIRRVAPSSCEAISSRWSLRARWN